MSKITLNNVASLIDATTAANTINANSATIQTAMDNTLSRDGTSPNTMQNNFDMNSFQILNLPTPATANSPARLQDVQAGGTITNIPAGGTTGQVLAKTSNTDYAVNWTSESAELVAGTNIVLTGTTPTTISTTTTPTFTTVNTATVPTTVDTLVARNTTDTLTNKTLTSPILTTPNIGVATATSINGNTITAGTGILTLAASKTLTNNNNLTLNAVDGKSFNLNNTITLAAGADGTTQTFQASDTIVGRATTDTLTNKTLTTPTLTTPVINGISTGTGVSTTATANTLVLRDGNINAVSNNFLAGFTTIATAGGTTTLTITSTSTQVFTGTTSNQTVVLPVASTLALGTTFTIINACTSTGLITVQSSGANTIVILPGGTSATFVSVLTSGTTAASWTYHAGYQAGQLVGTGTNDNALAGNVGEYIESVVPTGSAVSLTSAVNKDITTISLTAGDWDVTGTVGFIAAGTTTCTITAGSISTTLNTIDFTNGRVTNLLFATVTPGAQAWQYLPVPVCRFSLSSTTTMHLVATSTFAVSTMTGFGNIRARRVR